MKLILSFITVALAAASLSVSAGHHEGDAEMQTGGGRVVVVAVEARIEAIDVETKEVTLLGPQGNYVTVVAQEQVVSLADLNVGDMVAAEYIASLEGEVREPTEEELANPWAVVTDKVATEVGAEHPLVGAARQIRAVCSIEAADRDAGYIMVKDSRGKLHTITDIEREKFEGVTLGDTIVIVYSEALAVGIEKVAAAPEGEMAM